MWERSLDKQYDRWRTGDYGQDYLDCEESEEEIEVECEEEE